MTDRINIRLTAAAQAALLKLKTQDPMASITQVVCNALIVASQIPERSSTLTQV